MVDQDPLVPEGHVSRETWPILPVRGPVRTELNETIWIEPSPAAGSGEL